MKILAESLFTTAHNSWLNDDSACDLTKASKYHTMKKGSTMYMPIEYISCPYCGHFFGFSPIANLNHQSLSCPMCHESFAFHKATLTNSTKDSSSSIEEPVNTAQVEFVNYFETMLQNLESDTDLVEILPEE